MLKNQKGGACALIKEIFVKKENRFHLSCSSKGNQIKWAIGRLFIKADTMGYEGISETLASELLSSVRGDYGFIKYYPCVINEEGIKYTGCYSYNYLKDNESFISVYRILQKKNKDIDIKLKKYSGLSLVDFVAGQILSVTGVDCRDYFGFLAFLDYLILNEDRHFHNINMIYDRDSGCYKLAPVFDNGLSLLSDTNDYPLNIPNRINIRNVKAKPFSADFKKQASYFNVNPICIDYSDFMARLKNVSGNFESVEFNRAKSVLLSQLKNLEGRVWIRV